MMTFYSAAGSYQLRTEESGKKPYIQRLGKLYPISIPEFIIWTSLLWQVMTYEELEKVYHKQMTAADVYAPDLDQMLQMLVRRKLVARGEGYTGMDALYSMMSEAFIVPTIESRVMKMTRSFGLFLRGKISFHGLKHLMRKEQLTEDPCYVMKLVRQTPLSVSELIHCFNRKITDVSTPEKVIAGIYPDEAVSNLYLQRHVLLEQV